ncbi:MAG: hypothetical protein HLUCCO02_09365 [Idiomarinaceae bacterium HL-53]|nr:MAG: hypothetical protein HLUCCO02_09365 [Idiomarinaceae bacterium HL-53]
MQTAEETDNLEVYFEALAAMSQLLFLPLGEWNKVQSIISPLSVN